MFNSKTIKYSAIQIIAIVIIWPFVDMILEMYIAPENLRLVSRTGMILTLIAMNYYEDLLEPYYDKILPLLKL